LTTAEKHRFVTCYALKFQSNAETQNHPKKRNEVSFKGLESKRRDNARIGAETQSHVLKLLLAHGNDMDSAIAYVKQDMSDIMLDKVDLIKYNISKGLSKADEDYNAKQPHVELKKRIEARASWTGEIVPQTGDRVPYVMIAGKGKACELAEDPLYAQRNGVPINRHYYIYI